MSEHQYRPSGSEALRQIDPKPWRDEVHARVSRYRTRRGRRIEGAFSMRFPFPASEAAAPVQSDPEPQTCPEPQAAMPVAAAAEEAATILPEPEVQPLQLAAAPPLSEQQAEPLAPLIAEPEPSSNTGAIEPKLAVPLPPPEPELVPPLRARGKRKVIAFPRPAAGAVHRLADPVFPEQPRILDVPEELEAFPTTPFLQGLQFGPDPQTAEPKPSEHVELPFRCATLAQRLQAGIIDGALVLAGALLFAAVAHEMLPQLVRSKSLLSAAALVPVLLWASYHYLFLVHGGSTLGMRLCGLRLRSFKGAAVKRRARRKRVIALYLSVGSLLMGALWALVDVDALCWHDRMSRTYLAAD